MGTGIRKKKRKKTVLSFKKQGCAHTAHTHIFSLSLISSPSPMLTRSHARASIRLIRAINVRCQGSQVGCQCATVCSAGLFAVCAVCGVLYISSCCVLCCVLCCVRCAVGLSELVLVRRIGTFFITRPHKKRFVGASTDLDLASLNSTKRRPYSRTLGVPV